MQFRVIDFFILVFVSMLLLPEEQKGEAWEPSKRQFCLGCRATLDIKVL